MAFQLNRSKRALAAYLEYTAARAAEAKAKAKKEAAKKVLEQARGTEREFKVGHDVVLRLVEKKRTTVSASTLAAQYPAIHAELAKTTPYDEWVQAK